MGANISHSDHWVMIDQVEQRLKCNSVGAENLPHRRTPACQDHLDHGVTVLEEVKQMCCVAGLAFGRTRIDLLYDLPFRRETFLSCSTSGQILTRSAHRVSPNSATPLSHRVSS